MLENAALTQLHQGWVGFGHEKHYACQLGPPHSRVQLGFEQKDAARSFLCLEVFSGVFAGAKSYGLVQKVVRGHNISVIAIVCSYYITHLVM